jgi:hypothetical protein
LTMHRYCFSRAALVLLLSLMCGTSMAQVELDTAGLETRKLELKIAQLEQQLGEWATWRPFILGGAGVLFAAFIAATASIWVANRSRRGLLDQAVHEKRLEFYPKLVAAGAPLALYFPNSVMCNRVIDQAACSKIGIGMRDCYYSGGSLLMSEEARDTYLLLALALTIASSVEGELDVPSREDYHSKVDSFVIAQYRKTLNLPTMWHQRKSSRRRMEMLIRNWKFGEGRTEPMAYRFKDYVLLQGISSELRTALTEDLHSRRLPS